LSPARIFSEFAPLLWKQGNAHEAILLQPLLVCKQAHRDSDKSAESPLRYTVCLGLGLHPPRIALLLFMPILTACPAETLPARPNVLTIDADDLGHGNPHCDNPERGKIAAPAIDKLAARGMRFTDAHSSSGVFTPSRYSLLTGRDQWRTVHPAGVLNGGSPPLLAPQRVTPATLEAEHGYRTACFGKWHLGLRWTNDGVDQPAPAARGPASTTKS
jgi:hypothetical protein